MEDDSARTEPAVVNSSSPLAEANSHMEWDASEYKWDAHLMIVHKSVISAPATAEAASGRRSERAAAVAAAAASAGTAKASKAKRNSGELACQVPGCNASLVGAKDYHQRYLICPQHAKVDLVELHGVSMRFCQQCGKFHELAQFDGTRHSCRQQLQRHNALRRRAPLSSQEPTSITAAAAATVRPASKPGCRSRHASHSSSSPPQSPAEDAAAAAALYVPISHSNGPAASVSMQPACYMGAHVFLQGDVAAMPAPVTAALFAAQQQLQQRQHIKVDSLHHISPPKTSSNDSFTHQQTSSNYRLQQAATSSGGSGDAAAGAAVGLQGNAPLEARQQPQRQQLPAGSQQAGLTGFVQPASASAAVPLDGPADDAALLQELLDELWPAGQSTAASDMSGQHVAAADACPAAAAAEAAGTGPVGAAGGLGSLTGDFAAVQAVNHATVHPMPAQQQQQHLGLSQQPQQILQQQQQPAAEPVGGTWHQGSNSSSTSNAASSSSAFPASRWTASAAAAAGVCRAGVPLYTYTAYQSASQIQQGHQLLSLPIPDSLLQSIAADLGLPVQQPSSQPQQQQQQMHAQVQPLLLQQAPIVQPVGWQGMAGSAAAASPVPGLAPSVSAVAYTAAPGPASLPCVQPQHAYMAATQLSPPSGIHPGMQQQQQLPAVVGQGAKSPQATTAPASDAAAAAAAAGGNPLAGQLTGSQRAAAASHIRSMLMVAAAAGESGNAVLARALQLMQQCGDWLPHTALLQLNSLSLKLMGVQPYELPEDVREQMIAAVVGAAMPEAFLRPGCSLLTLDYVTATNSSSSRGSSEAEGRLDAAAVLQRLCNNSSWFAQHGMRMQLAASSATWKPPARQQQHLADGESTGGSSTEGGGSCTAEAVAAPCVVLASRLALSQQDWQGAWLAVSCHGLAEGEQLQLTARGSGQYYDIDEESIAVERCAALPPAAGGSAASGGSWSSWLGSRLPRQGAALAAAAAGAGSGQSVLVWFRLAEQPQQGALRLEVTCSSTGATSNVVLLVSDDPLLVAEINTTADAQAAAAGAGAGAGHSSAAAHEQQLQELLWELGLVLELKSALLQAHSRHATAAAVRGSRGSHDSCCGCGCCCADGSCSCCHFAGQQLHHYSSTDVVMLVRAARRLAASAVKAGCLATAASVMPVAGLGLQGAEQVLAAAAAAARGGLRGDWQGVQPSLLHLAVASQNPQMVRGDRAPCAAAWCSVAVRSGQDCPARSSSDAAAGDTSWQQQQRQMQHSGSAALPGAAVRVPSPAASSESSILLLPDPSMRCCGLTPAALAAMVGRVVLNAAIARKLPGTAGWDLLAEAAAQAADVAAGKVPAAAALAEAEEEEALKPKAASAQGNSGDGDQQLCPVCQLPLTSFNRHWHQHHSPIHLATPQQQQGSARAGDAAGFDGVTAGPASSSSKGQLQYMTSAQDDLQQPAAAGGVPLPVLAALVAALLLLGLLSSAFVRILE